MNEKLLKCRIADYDIKIKELEEQKKICKIVLDNLTSSSQKKMEEC